MRSVLGRDEVVRAAGLRAEEVQAAAAVELLRRELAELDDAELSLIREYAVCSAAELEAALNAGRWPEHPTWERLIHWENSEDRRKNLRTFAAHAEDVRRHQRLG